MKNLRVILFAAIAAFAVYYFIAGNKSNDDTVNSYQTDDSDWGTDDNYEPTNGVITTVVEVEPDNFKIEDETSISNPEESLVIAKYMDGQVDTFTLDEMKVAASATESSDTTDNGRHHYRRRSSISSLIMYGYMGYMMGGFRNRNSFRPNANAYVNRQAYDRVSNSTGKNFSPRTTSTRSNKPSSSKPSSPKSNYGGGGSTRSFGG